MRERLGAVGEVVEDDPAAQRAPDEADERELDERPLDDALLPRL
jgi:hypothetical protein